MARVHTDFIVLNDDDYEFFIQLLMRYEDVLILQDVPLNRQLYFESKLSRDNKRVIKRQYVK